MAKSRDRVTRATKANDKFVSESLGQRWQTRLYTRTSGVQATERKRGRRGVRARARLARQLRAQQNDQQAIYRRAVAEGRTGGLFRQPDGGYSTNS